MREYLLLHLVDDPVGAPADFLHEGAGTLRKSKWSFICPWWLFMKNSFFSRYDFILFYYY